MDSLLSQVRMGIRRYGKVGYLKLFFRLFFRRFFRRLLWIETKETKETKENIEEG